MAVIRTSNYVLTLERRSMRISEESAERLRAMTEEERVDFAEALPIDLYDKEIEETYGIHFIELDGEVVVDHQSEATKHE